MNGKTAIITGGGQGIGKAVARALLERGANIVLAEMDVEAGREAEEEFRSLGPVKFIHTDVGDEAMVKAMVESTVESFGGVDILVNNAGVFIEKRLEELTLQEWNRIISINLTGAYLCSRYAAVYLRKSKGIILNIGSTRSLMSEPDTEAYAASKGGITALTHALSISLGPDVRVNCISPGWIDVSEWKKKGLARKAELSEQDHRQHPAGRVGRPEDIASLVLYLASPEASFVTGSNIVVDGGMTRKMIYA
ncbi:MAG: glucose 1-dehydrogenase [Acidobacteriota bacterium]